MLTIDGSRGEGGGQILRSALALSLVTETPFRIINIRRRRSKPGLMRQHLAAVHAAMDVGAAEVKGDQLGSRELVFRPTTIRSGNYRFSIGSAGSCTLVLQTVLPALCLAPGPSDIELEGGTHNPFAPPFDFLAYAFLPLLERMGPGISAKLMQPGFYPAGGGKIRVHIEPTPRLVPVDLHRRGKILDYRACAMIANLPRHIAERELRTVAQSLGWDPQHLCIEEVAHAQGPGNVLSLKIISEYVTEVFTGFGERRVTAEQVAQRACKQARAYMSAQAPIGPHLADQLLLPMALTGGGSFRTMPPSSHSKTNIEVIQSFLPVDVRIAQIKNKQWEIWITKNEEGYL